MPRFLSVKSFFCAGLLAMAGLIGSAVAPVQAQTTIPGADLPGPAGGSTLIIGGGLPFGLYFPLAGTLCRLVETGSQGSPCAVASLADSSAAISALQSGRVPFALVQSDWLHHAVQGTSRFREVGPAQDLRTVSSFFTEAFTILVRATGPIQQLEDLDDKRVSVGPDGSYRAIIADAALDSAGLDRDDLVEASVEPVVNALGRLCDGQLDAVVAMAVHPAELISSAARRCGVVPLSMSEDEVAELLDSLLGYAAVEIPARTYTGQAAPVRTVGLRTVLATTVNTNPTLVSQLTSTIARGLARLNGAHPTFSAITADDLAMGARFAPLHPSAAQVLGVASQ